MKKRSDFVSNSSSSSFIIEDSPIYEYFEITKQDIIDALTDLIGKEYIEKYKKDSRKWADNKNCSDDELGPFYVYDLSDEKDRHKALDRWGLLLEDWDARFVGLNSDGKPCYPEHSHEYRTAAEYLAKIYNLNCYSGIIKDSEKDEDITCWIRTNEKQKNGCYGYDAPAPKEVIQILRDIRKRCGIISNKEAIQLECAKFFVHFDDNEIWNLNGAYMPSKNDKPYENPTTDYEKKHNEELTKTLFTSEYASKERVFEILYNYWITQGKIKADDDEFLNAVFPADEWIKKAQEKHSDWKYATANHKTLGYRDLCDTLLTFEGHEG